MVTDVNTMLVLEGGWSMAYVPYNLHLYLPWFQPSHYELFCCIHSCERMCHASVQLQISTGYQIMWYTTLFQYNQINITKNGILANFHPTEVCEVKRSTGYSMHVRLVSLSEWYGEAGKVNPLYCRQPAQAGIIVLTLKPWE